MENISYLRNLDPKLRDLVMPAYVESFHSVQGTYRKQLAPLYPPWLTSWQYLDSAARQHLSSLQSSREEDA